MSVHLSHVFRGLDLRMLEVRGGETAGKDIRRLQGKNCAQSQKFAGFSERIVVATNPKTGCCDFDHWPHEQSSGSSDAERVAAPAPRLQCFSLNHDVIDPGGCARDLARMPRTPAG